MWTCNKDIFPHNPEDDNQQLENESNTLALANLERSITNYDSQIVVGYWMIPNYFSKLRMDGFESFCRKSRRIKLYQMNLSDDDLKVDVFLHRIYDVMISALMGNSDAASFIDHFEKFNQTNPQILTTDSLQGSKALQHRAQFNSRLMRMQFGEGIQVPLTEELNSYQHAQTIRASREFTYPLICKPIIAHATDDDGNGSEECHEMMLVFKPEQLAHLQYPCVAQQFIDHNATLFKLYVIGKYVHVCVRPSVRNLSGFNSSKVIRFKTKDVSKKNSNTILNYCPSRYRFKDFDGCKSGYVPYNMGLQFQAIAEQLKKEFRITLFGADVIISKSTNTYYVIDINTCPDFFLVDDFWMNLEDLLVYAGRCTKTGNHDALFNHHCHIASYNKF